MSVSKGTTNRQAFKNKKLRDEIAHDSEIKTLLNSYNLEDSSQVTLDENIVIQHIRAVINDSKRSKLEVIKYVLNVYNDSSLLYI